MKDNNYKHLTAQINYLLHYFSLLTHNNLIFLISTSIHLKPFNLTLKSSMSLVFFLDFHAILFCFCMKFALVANCVASICNWVEVYGYLCKPWHTFALHCNYSKLQDWVSMCDWYSHKCKKNGYTNVYFMKALTLLHYKLCVSAAFYT